jgi:hypothetical protein
MTREGAASPREFWVHATARGSGGALPFRDLPWHDLLIRLRPQAARHVAIGPLVRHCRVELESRVHALADTTPMYEMPQSDEDREGAIQSVLALLVPPDVADHVQKLSMSAEDYVRARFRRATIRIWVRKYALTMRRKPLA